jgi:hypothetical protein
MNGSHAHGPMNRRTGDNNITHNHIYAGGRVFHSAIGVLMMHTFGNKVAHNHIHDFYYSGVSCGWVWGYAESVTKNNHIEFNYIHDLGHGLLSDMGGIYTLGVQPGTVLRGNVIHDVEKCNYGGWAIYLDEGSSHIVVENNVCYNTSSQPFNQHYGRENIVRNNIFAFGREGQVSLGRAEAHTSFNLYRNIIITNGQPVLVGGNFGQLDRQGIQSNLNLYWDVTGGDIISGNRAYDAQAQIYWPRTYPLSEMQAMGYDQHSVVADPGFANLDQLDFRLAEETAARRIGFHAFEIHQAGPRPKEERDR